jgi:hypothetical protein
VKARRTLIYFIETQEFVAVNDGSAFVTGRNQKTGCSGAGRDSGAERPDS